MNWMIITDDTEKDSLIPAIDFLSKKDVNYSIFNLNQSREDIFEIFCRNLGKATHCVICTDKETSLRNSPFLVYAAGYISGKKIPSFVSSSLHDTNKKVMNKFNSFESVEKLVTKLRRNFPSYMEEEARQEAHKKLFEEGIPFTPDCFSFHIAKENEKTCSLFLDAGMDINCRDSAGTPMICIAARSGRKSMIEWLVSKGADINAVSKDRGYSAVMDAVWKSSLDIVDILIQKGANLNFIANDGQSALIVATGASNPRICELLVRNGADPTYKDRMGMSSLDYARLFKKNDLVEIYEEYVK